MPPRRKKTTPARNTLFAIPEEKKVTTVNATMEIKQYRFCTECEQLCTPHLLPSTKAKSGYILVDKCKHCGFAKELDNNICYNIVI